VGAQRELPAQSPRDGLLSLPRRPAAIAAAAALLALPAALALGDARASGARASGAMGAVASLAAATAGAGAWSPVATLGSCAANGFARAAFPRDSPMHATGRGAIVWSAASECPGGAGTLVSVIGRDDIPARPAYARAPGGSRLTLHPPLALAPAPHGQLAIAGSPPSAVLARGQLVQGSAGGPFSALGTIAGGASQDALATGYLGDLAVASPTGGDSGRAGARIDVERYFAHALSPSRVVPARGGAVDELTVSLDYRTDAIAAWHQDGALYAHDLPASGRAQPTQRLADVGPAPRITSLISDDNRAIVAWADERGPATSIYLDASASGVRFGAPRLLERFDNPAGLPYPATSPRLIRLSSESVMMAWTGAQQGHWVVRAAAIDLNGLRKTSTISDPGSDALLSDLEPGPTGEALALWSEPQRTPDGRLDLGRQALVAARGIDAYPGRTIFGQPEQIAAAGPNEDATVAFDPASDRALALWRGERGAVQYAIRASSRRRGRLSGD
jgi:hypothetical protein